MRRVPSRIFFMLVGLAVAVGTAFAAPGYLDVPVNGSRLAETATGAGLPSYFGSSDDCHAVFRLGPFAPGKRYELTLTFDAGTDIGYGMSWVDGDPWSRDAASFVGIGTGTGTREMKGKESKFLFTVDAKSTASFLFLVVRSNKPWKLAVGLTDRLSGKTRDSQDPWGYYYVTDFDVDRTSPFLLTRGQAAAPTAEAPASGYVDVAPGQAKKTATTSGWTWIPNWLGGPEGFHAVFRLGPFAAGKRYEATLTFDAGTDIGYGMTWLDGDPKGKDVASFLGLGTGTGTREMKGKESKFLFTIDAKSTASFLYLIVRSNKPWELAMALTDRLSGATPDSLDKWGYYFVSDFDVDRYAPFLLIRGPAQ